MPATEPSTNPSAVTVETGAGVKETGRGSADVRPSRAAKILRRTLVGGSLTLAVALLLWLTDETGSGVLVLAVGSVLAALAAWEAGRLEDRIAEDGRHVATFATALAATLSLLVWLRVSGGDLLGGPGEPALRSLALYALCAAAALVVALALTRRGRRSRPGLLALWIVPPLPALVLVFDAAGVRGLVVLIVLSKIGDVAGYYGGSAFGRHHPFPALSPGKTTEGCVASLVGALVAAALFASSGMLAAGLGPALALGAAINLAAQSGDLLESAFKRRARVKDSSALFGPSGGALDVVDSLLLTVPTFLVLGPWLV